MVWVERGQPCAETGTVLLHLRYTTSHYLPQLISASAWGAASTHADAVRATAPLRAACNLRIALNTGLRGENTREIQLQDIDVHQDQSVPIGATLTFHVHGTKTDSEAGGDTVYPMMPYMKDTYLCPALGIAIALLLVQADGLVDPISPSPSPQGCGVRWRGAQGVERGAGRERMLSPFSPTSPLPLSQRLPLPWSTQGPYDFNHAR